MGAAGRAVVPSRGVPGQPTSRDDVIRADLARGVPAAAIAAEWGLEPAVVDYIAETMRRGTDDGPSRYEMLLERFQQYAPDGVGVDPDERRDPQAAAFHRDRLSPNTRRMYRQFAPVYLDFCARTGRREVPANRFTLEAFTIYLAQTPIKRGKNKGKIGMAPNSIGVALSAVGALHRACGENPPDRSLARGIIEGHANRRRQPGSGIRDDVGSPAVDLPTFIELVAACPPDTNAGLRDRALLTLGLAMMARRSELCILDLDDVVVRRSGRWMDVHVSSTKTGKSRDVQVPRLGDDMAELCAVRAWEAYRQRLSELGITAGPVFRGVDRWDNVHGVAAFAGRRSMTLRLDGSHVEQIVLRAALRAAVPNAEELSPHGVFRHTGATEAYRGGADVLAIARQGGWADNSPVVFRYIDKVDRARNPILLFTRELLDREMAER